MIVVVSDGAIDGGGTRPVAGGLNVSSTVVAPALGAGASRIVVADVVVAPTPGCGASRIVVEDFPAAAAPGCGVSRIVVPDFDAAGSRIVVADLETATPDGGLPAVLRRVGVPPASPNARTAKLGSLAGIFRNRATSSGIPAG